MAPMHREIRKGVWRGTKILNQENVTPEVCLEVVRNAVTTFSTTPRSAQPCPNGGFPFGHTRGLSGGGNKLRNPQNVIPEDDLKTHWV